jgi:hypothetical protein
VLIGKDNQAIFNEIVVIKIVVVVVVWVVVMEVMDDQMEVAQYEQYALRLISNEVVVVAVAVAVVEMAVVVAVVVVAVVAVPLVLVLALPLIVFHHIYHHLVLELSQVLELFHVREEQELALALHG